MRSPRSVFVCAALLASLAAAGCSTPTTEGLALSGRVVDDPVSVSVPPLPAVAPRISAAVPSAAQRSRTTTVAALSGLGQAGRVASVAVSPGDRVSAGDVVALLDDAALVANVEAARTAERAAAAQVEVLGARLADTADARTTIAENRRTASDAIAQLTTTRADLAAKLAAARVQLVTLQGLQAKLSQLPPGGVVPTGSVPPGTPNPAQVAAAIAQLQAGIAKLEGAIAKIDAGLAKARGGLAKLADASAQLSDARATLRGVRDVASVAAQGSRVAVDLARAQLDLTVLRAPAAGTVIATVRPGEALSTGAPVVTIRPEAPSAVDVYVAPERARGLAPGDTALVTTDSDPSRSFPASVTWVGVRALYPPSWLATTETHLTRAFPVRVTLDDPAVSLAPGTPADVTITPGPAK